MEDSKDKQPEQAAPTLRVRLTSSLRAALGWIKANRLKAGLLAGACLVSIALPAGYWLILGNSRNVVHRAATMEMALEALDGGSYVEARELAESLRQRAAIPREALGGPTFVLGAAASYEADDTWSREKTGLYLLASRYLEEARDLGFPPKREVEGLFLLGKSLYRSGQIPASRPILRLALEADKQGEANSEIFYLLAGACLNDANPKLDEALQYNSRYLANKKLSSQSRDEALLQQAEILFRNGQTEQCQATLAKIRPEAKNRSDAIILQGRVLIQEARQLSKTAEEDTAEQIEKKRQAAKEKYQAGIKVLRKARGYDTLDNQATRKAMYLIGICFLEMGDRRSSLEEFSRMRTLFSDTPETLAADLEEAELLLRSGRDADALAAYKRVLDTIFDPMNFSNPWVTLDGLRVRMLKAYEYLCEKQRYETCLRLSRTFYPLFSRVRTMQLTSRAYREWGEELLSRAESLPPKKAEAARKKGRLQLRHAGQVYGRIARCRIITSHYPDDLWDSAQCYLEGQGFKSAVRVLKKYLENESRRRHPQALVNLGEALLALERIDDALAAFRECVEFHPRDAAAYRARLLASGAYLEKSEFDKAEKLLMDNLGGDLLTPASREWRDSLFSLGYLLQAGGRYEQAIRRLEEAVKRYPDTPQALNAGYLIALCHRRSAKRAREESKKDLVESTRLFRSKQIKSGYTAALAQYEVVRKKLNQRMTEIELTALQKATLKNCYFAIGDMLFELERYEEAIKAYSTATNRYQMDPEVLEAYVQIASAYRHLDEPLKARGTLAQAKVVLARMKTETPFEQSTNYTKEQWGVLLNQLSSL